VAIIIFIITSTYVSEKLTHTILMCVGGFFIFLSFTISISLINITNRRIKQHFKNVFIKKQTQILNAIIKEIPELKIFFNVENEIIIEKNGEKKILILTKDFTPNIKFKLNKGSSYYSMISRNVANQITNHVIKELDKL
jgi:hypothetical protein